MHVPARLRNSVVHRVHSHHICWPSVPINCVTYMLHVSQQARVGESLLPCVCASGSTAFQRPAGQQIGKHMRHALDASARPCNILRTYPTYVQLLPRYMPGMPAPDTLQALADFEFVARILIGILLCMASHPGLPCVSVMPAATSRSICWCASWAHLNRA
jgi:hypothetical protein